MNPTISNPIQFTKPMMHSLTLYAARTMTKPKAYFIAFLGEERFAYGSLRSMNILFYRRSSWELLLVVASQPSTQLDQKDISFQRCVATASTAIDCGVRGGECV